MERHRFGKEIEIAHSFSNATQKDVIGLLNLMKDELKYQNIQKLLIKLFLSLKTQFTDESLDNILNFCNNNLSKTNKKSKSLKNAKTKKNDSKNNNLKCARIEELPKDILIRIMKQILIYFIINI